MFINLSNERIFIAGHSGMVGSAICRALKNTKKHLNDQNILLTPSRKELDLLDKNSVEKWFKNNKPTIVVVAAAKVGGIIANSIYSADFILENLKIQNIFILVKAKIAV